MKFRYFLSIILTVAMLFAFQAVCNKPAAEAETKSSKASSATKAKAPGQTEWETVVNNARKEGKVVIYGAVLGSARTALSKVVKDKYGLDLDFLSARGGETAERVLRERQAGLKIYDVVMEGTTALFNSLKPAKMIGSIEAVLLLDEVKNPSNWRIGKIPYLDNEKTVVPLASQPSFFIVVNTDMVKEGEIKNYDDLLNPKWAGKILVNDPTTEGPGLTWFHFMMVQNYGPQKGAEYFRKLVANGLSITRDDRLLVESVAKGKFPVAVGPKRTTVLDFAKLGAPVKAPKISGKALVSSGPWNLCVSDAPAHPNAQKVFVNFIMGREAGEILMKASGYASERADVSTAGIVDPALVPGPKDMAQLEEDLLTKEDSKKVAAEIFKEFLK